MRFRCFYADNAQYIASIGGHESRAGTHLQFPCQLFIFFIAAKARQPTLKIAQFSQIERGSRRKEVGLWPFDTLVLKYPGFLS